MFRKIALVATTAAFAFGGVAVFGTTAGAAAAPPVNASGSLACSITGKAKITPPLLFGGITPASTVTKVKLVCTGTSGVTSGKGIINQSVPNNDCATPTTGATGTFSWKGALKYNPTNIAFGVASSNISGPAPVTTTEFMIPSGSFGGQIGTQIAKIDQTIVTYALLCAGKGVKKTSYTGVNGVSTFTIAP